LRNKSFIAGVLFLIIALALPAIIFSQQNRSARRTSGSNPERSASANSSGSKTTATAPLIKSDLAEALSVIQANHIDGKKLDYN